MYNDYFAAVSLCGSRVIPCYINGPSSQCSAQGLPLLRVCSIAHHHGLYGNDPILPFSLW